MAATIKKRTYTPEVRYRVIVRLSLNGEGTSIWNKVRPLLEKIKFRKTGTGTFEYKGPDFATVAMKLHEVMQILAELDPYSDFPSDTTLDHLWVYIDTSEAMVYHTKSLG